MSRRINVCATVLLVLFELTTSAMVLPRPPSSPNHIRQDQELSARKSLDGKSLHDIPRNTNVERPDTEDYRYRQRSTRPFPISFSYHRPILYSTVVVRCTAIHFRFALRIASLFDVCFDVIDRRSIVIARSKYSFEIVRLYRGSL